jgi:hypothetical protein
MLRLLCLVACFLVNNSVAAEKYIRVTGEATTIEQAKENAFRTAVQQRAGAIVLSEREARMSSLTKDNISVFSAGYVDDFKIIDITQNGSTIRITMDILVAESKLLNQVLTTGKTEQGIDGNRAGVAVSTYLDQKDKGDQMLDMVLNTYPQNAFTIQQKPFTLAIDGYRNTLLQVPYTIKWNKDYIHALNEALTLLEDKISFFQEAPAKIVIGDKDPISAYTSKWQHKFNDLVTYNKIVNSMKDDRAARFLLEIYDNNGSLLYHACYVMPLFYSIQFKQLTFMTSRVETSYLQATIDQSHRYVIDRASRIELLSVPDSKCHW